MRANMATRLPRMQQLICLAIVFQAAAASASVEHQQEAAAAARVRKAQAALDAAQLELAEAQRLLQQQQQQQQQQAAAAPPPEPAAAPACRGGLTQVDGFALNGSQWSACEDLSTPGGALALLSSDGAAEWFSKSHEPYVQGDDEDYYLGLGKDVALKAKTDLLGQTILTGCAKPTPTTKLCEPTWSAVERAVPIMRRSGGGHQGGACPPGAGVRTFVGSRGSSVDAALSDHMEDCSSNGFPPVQSYVMNLTAVAMNEPPIKDFKQYLNFSFIADGLVGGFEPNVIFYFPVIANVTAPKSRYWTVIAAPVADMKGGREQSVWFRFQQLQCAGADAAPPCKLHGTPQYWDTYWYSRSPITKNWVPPDKIAGADGFYENLLLTRQYWKQTLADEGMSELLLPSKSGGATNGSWLHTQATHAIVRSMISREDTWHGRYGVLPGYGVSLQDGFQVNDPLLAHLLACLRTYLLAHLPVCRDRGQQCSVCSLDSAAGSLAA